MGNAMDMRYEVISESNQDFTTSWVDYGSEVSALGHRKVGFWVKVDINDTLNARLRVICKLQKDATDEFTPQIQTSDSNDILVEANVYEFNADADNNAFIVVETHGLMPFLQLQISAGTAGASPGGVEAAYVTKID